MNRSDILNLIAVTYIKDDIGQEIEQEVLKQVFCQVESVSMSEWFRAGRDGMKPQYKVTMFFYDYNGEQVADYNGERYAVYRTYIRNNELIELYLEKKVGL